jgi:hypothetical protein
MECLDQSGTESGTVGKQCGKVAPDLAVVVKSRPALPHEVRKWILGVIRAASVAAQFGTTSLNG